LSIEEAHESNASKFTVIGVFKDSFAALAISPIYFIGLSVLSYFCLKQIDHSRAFFGISRYYHHDIWGLALIMNILISTIINMSVQIIIAQYILRSQECGATICAKGKFSFNPITIIENSYFFITLMTLISLVHYFIYTSVLGFIADITMKWIIFLLPKYLNLIPHITSAVYQIVSLPFNVALYFSTFLALLCCEKSLEELEVFRYAKKLLACCYSKILIIICLRMIIGPIYSYFIFYILGFLFNSFHLKVFVLNIANGFMFCFYYIMFAVACIDLEKSYLAKKHISQEA
jgi:hypothetical protein